MPLPKPSKTETEQEFVSRCAGDEMMNKEFKDQKQRLAVCYSQYKIRHKAKGEVNWNDVRKGDSLNIL
jgi:hypothetical protein